jgi:hypothetical protein
MYKFAISLMVIQVLYALGWAAHDLAARLGLWRDAGLAAEFINSVSLTQEALFAGHVVLNIVALALLLRRSRLSLPVYAVSFALDRTDWILMTGNLVMPRLVDLTLTTSLSFTLQGLLLALLVTLSFDGTLGRRR